MQLLKLLSAAALSLTVAACSTLSLELAPSATLTPVEVTVGPTPAPPSATPAAPEPTATVALAADVLPRAVYFLAAADGQVWRLAADGRTLTQITHERAAISEFDLSPVDGALAYVTENTLIRADAEGGRRTVLLTGPALTGAEGEGITSVIHQPLWSPDGQTLAFGLNGVNLMPAAGGAPQMIQASDAIPQTRAEARFYRPYAWSPDGLRLVMAVSDWQEGLAYAVKDVSRPAVTPSDITAACCEPVWSRDSQSLYFFGADVEGYNAPGLWRVNAATGEAERLIEGRDANSPTVRTVRYAFEAPDGTLYFWLAAQTPNADFIYTQPALYQLYSLPAGAGAGAASAQVRGEGLAVNYGGAVWSAEPPAGVLVGLTDPDLLGKPGGPLVWAPLDPARALVTLPADGSALRWQ
ncbi:MAG: PD40 domain-containing protein [Anaerolineales bacterium]|nr:PD40 domain-containing protein [Anaerolineales bacterium]